MVSNTENDYLNNVNPQTNQNQYQNNQIPINNQINNKPVQQINTNQQQLLINKQHLLNLVEFNIILLKIL